MAKVCFAPASILFIFALAVDSSIDHCECTGPCPEYGKWTCHYANGTVDQKYKYGDMADCAAACHSDSSSTLTATSPPVHVALVPVDSSSDHCECTGPCPTYGQWTCHYANGTVDQKYKYGDKADCAAACHSDSSNTIAATSPPVHVALMHLDSSSDHCECTGPCPTYGQWTCHYANGTVDPKYKYGDMAECAAACHSDGDTTNIIV